MPLSMPGFSQEPIQTPKVALAVAYNGSHYHGWQLQTNPFVPTVQYQVEQALERVAARDLRIHCAGRTDHGVHATYQVIHFDNLAIRPEKAWVLGGNANLPEDISILWARGVPADFHARFSATARTYRYLIHNAAVRSAVASRQYTFYSQPLDSDLMHAEAQCLLGERDFSSFRGAGCQSNSPFRCVHHVSVQRFGQVVCVEIKANAFLLHMVRNIVGVLLAVGSGQMPPGWTSWVLEQKDRTKGGVTAPPTGLYLVDVDYPEHFGLSGSSRGPLFYPFP